MFKVRKFQQFENLLLEADIIRFEDQFSGINQDFRHSSGNDSQEEDGDPNAEAWKRLDYLIDMLLDRGIVDLEQALKDPIYRKEFGSVRGMEISTAYLEYCRKKIRRLSIQLDEEFKKEDRDVESIQRIAAERIQVAARVQALERIYEAFKLLRQEELGRIADEVLKKVASIKDEVSSQNDNTIVEVGKLIQPEMAQILDSDTQQEGKEHSATKVITTLIALEKVLPFYGEETKASAEKAKKTAEKTIKDKIGEERYQTLYRTILSNDQEVQILKRILNLRHQNFTSEQDILKEIDSIKISINGLEGVRHGRPLSKPEVIEFLKKTLMEEADYVLGKAREKTITLKDAKGIHFDFRTKLKLHEEVDLPVTGKQIADATWLMKFRKRFTYIMNLLPVGQTPVTPAGQAWANLGKQTHKLYAIALNSAGKFIGKMLKGREGQMKGDSVTRLFIPDTSVLDEPGPLAPNAVSEEVAPGVSMQVPGSIGSMGPIVPPTENSIGSGDNFNPKKKKKKRRSVYEERMQIMNFDAFVSKNNRIGNGI